MGSGGMRSGIDHPRRALRRALRMGALGAWNDENDPNGDERDRHAEQYYEALRRSKRAPIVEKLSKHGGISQKSAQKVFDHVFINEYELDGVRKRFDASYDMAQSFQRLLSGKGIQEHDFILLRHERLERELMVRYNKDYRTAHDKTDRKYNYARAADEWKARRGK